MGEANKMRGMRRQQLWIVVLAALLFLLIAPPLRCNAHASSSDVQGTAAAPQGTGSNAEGAGTAAGGGASLEADGGSKAQPAAAAVHKGDAAVALAGSESSIQAPRPAGSCSQCSTSGREQRDGASKQPHAHVLPSVEDTGMAQNNAAVLPGNGRSQADICLEGSEKKNGSIASANRSAPAQLPGDACSNSSNRDSSNGGGSTPNEGRHISDAAPDDGTGGEPMGVGSTGAEPPAATAAAAGTAPTAAASAQAAELEGVTPDIAQADPTVPPQQQQQQQQPAGTGTERSSVVHASGDGAAVPGGERTVKRMPAHIPGLEEFVSDLSPVVPQPQATPQVAAAGAESGHLHPHIQTAVAEDVASSDLLDGAAAAAAAGAPAAAAAAPAAPTGGINGLRSAAAVPTPASAAAAVAEAAAAGSDAGGGSSSAAPQGGGSSATPEGPSDADFDAGRRINLADADDGAAVVAANKEAKWPDRAIDYDGDSYMKNKCAAQKWLIIELSQLGRVDMIEMTMKEMYSSRVKHFTVHGRHDHPHPKREPGVPPDYTAGFVSDAWHLLGDFTAANSKGTQSFVVPAPVRMRYLLVRFLSHYGNEDVCALNQLRVMGVSAAQELEMALREMNQPADEPAPVQQPVQVPQPMPVPAPAPAHAESEDGTTNAACGGGTAAEPAATAAAAGSSIGDATVLPLEKQQQQQQQQQEQQQQEQQQQHDHTGFTHVLSSLYPHRLLRTPLFTHARAGDSTHGRAGCEEGRGVGREDASAACTKLGQQETVNARAPGEMQRQQQQQQQLPEPACNNDAAAEGRPVTEAADGSTYGDASEGGMPAAEPSPGALLKEGHEKRNGGDGACSQAAAKEQPPLFAGYGGNASGDGGSGHGNGAASPCVAAANMSVAACEAEAGMEKGGVEDMAADEGPAPDRDGGDTDAAAAATAPAQSIGTGVPHPDVYEHSPSVVCTEPAATPAHDGVGVGDSSIASASPPMIQTTGSMAAAVHLTADPGLMLMDLGGVSAKPRPAGNLFDVIKQEFMLLKLNQTRMAKYMSQVVDLLNRNNADMTQEVQELEDRIRALGADGGATHARLDAALDAIQVSEERSAQLVAAAEARLSEQLLQMRRDVAAAMRLRDGLMLLCLGGMLCSSLLLTWRGRAVGAAPALASYMSATASGCGAKVGACAATVAHATVAAVRPGASSKAAARTALAVGALGAAEQQSTLTRAYLEHGSSSYDLDAPLGGSDAVSSQNAASRAQSGPSSYHGQHHRAAGRPLPAREQSSESKSTLASVGAAATAANRRNSATGSNAGSGGRRGKKALPHEPSPAQNAGKGKRRLAPAVAALAPLASAVQGGNRSLRAAVLWVATLVGVPLAAAMIVPRLAGVHGFPCSWTWCLQQLLEHIAAFTTPSGKRGS